MADDFFDSVAKDWDENAARMLATEETSEAIKNALPPGTFEHGLEIGAGTGLLGVKLLHLFRHLTFCDTSEGMLDELRRKLKSNAITNADVLSFDFSRAGYEKGFDCIFSQMLFHHVKDIPAYVKNLLASLNPGGFLCTVDLDVEDGSFHSGREGIYHNGIERDYFKGVLEKEGMTIYHESTPLIMHRNDKDYPAFLIIGKKA